MYVKSTMTEKIILVCKDDPINDASLAKMFISYVLHVFKVEMIEVIYLKGVSWIA